MTADEVIAELHRHANPDNVEGQARFGIETKTALGISVPTLRAIAKRCGADHKLAVALWDSGIHEARHIAAMVEDPRTVTRKQLESWARDSTPGTSPRFASSSTARRTPTTRAEVEEQQARVREARRLRHHGRARRPRQEGPRRRPPPVPPLISASPATTATSSARPSTGHSARSASATAPATRPRSPPPSASTPPAPSPAAGSPATPSANSARRRAGEIRA